MAWLYWNPSREAWFIPLLGRPIAWYGLLFAAGFALAYFLLNPILSRFLRHTGQLCLLDLLDGPALMAAVRAPSAALARLMAQFSPAGRKELETQPLTPAWQHCLLEECNRLLLSGSCTREELQGAWGSALATPRQTAYYLTDRLFWFAVAGTLIGARLGAVFLYDWPYFRAHPAEIVQIWQGGLASHGGFAGLIAALYLYARYIRRWLPALTFGHLLDFVAVPAMLVCAFIRLGNFVNQEIVGTPTTLPWGVIFGQPIGAPAQLPLHPVQLYEAALYLATFAILWFLWRRQELSRPPGALLGWSFLLGFGGRFILEFWKAAQNSPFSSFGLEPGQILSIPFILAGLFLIGRSRKICVIL